MKLLIAFMRSEQFAAVQAEVQKLELQMMTASEVFDYQEQGPTETYRGRQFRRPVSKVRLEIAVEDELAAAAAEAIGRAGAARGAGAAKVLVIDLDERPDPIVQMRHHPGYLSLSPILQ